MFQSSSLKVVVEIYHVLTVRRANPKLKLGENERAVPVHRTPKAIYALTVTSSALNATRPRPATVAVKENSSFEILNQTLTAKGVV